MNNSIKDVKKPTFAYALFTVVACFAVIMIPALAWGCKIHPLFLLSYLVALPLCLRLHVPYKTLQTGVVDGAEQPIANYQANAFPEVAPNIILDGHTLGAIQVVITDEAWDSLTPEQQDVLTEAGEYASQYNRQISQETEDKILEELKADGVNVIEVDDITPWQDACKDVIEEATKNNKDLYQQIVDMQ